MLQWQSVNSVPLGSVAAHTLIIGFFPSVISSSCGENLFFGCCKRCLPFCQRQPD